MVSGFDFPNKTNPMIRLFRIKLAIKLLDPEINHVMVRNLEPLLEKGWMIGPATAVRPVLLSVFWTLIREQNLSCTFAGRFPQRVFTSYPLVI